MEHTLPDTQSKDSVVVAYANGDNENTVSVEHGLAAAAGRDTSSTSSTENLPVFTDIKVIFMHSYQCWCMLMDTSAVRIFEISNRIE